MLFNSPIFVFCFLPAAFVIHWLSPRLLRNFVLLVLSFIFYWWGGSAVIGIILASIGLNWIFGLIIGLARSNRIKFVALVIGVTVNLGILVYNKYFTLLFSTIFGHSPDYRPDLIIPLGISFYTFHSISYLVDLYRAIKRPFINPVDFGLYISLFPQLVAGPIVRFHDIADQITDRSLTWDRLASGCQRFVFGLAKKILIADHVGAFADHIFRLPASDLSMGNAWLGTLCFSLQIYYDFSGYSDMAIGLARMFGFELMENFNYPYLADSITDFWHRWHLSLSAWFRDYLYIPLGGNRGSMLMTYRNMLVVFLLCGIWHGANWNFLLWGAYNGFFLIVERQFNVNKYLPAWGRHLYALLAIAFGWVIFRTTSFSHACYFMGCLIGFQTGSAYGEGVATLINPEFYLTLAVGILFAFPIFTYLASDFQVRRFPNKATHLTRIPSPFLRLVQNHPFFLSLIRSLVCLLLLLICFSEMAVSTVHSFIYFNF